jgi:hypothetical protein
LETKYLHHMSETLQNDLLTYAKLVIQPSLFCGLYLEMTAQEGRQEKV